MTAIVDFDTTEAPLLPAPRPRGVPYPGGTWLRTGYAPQHAAPARTWDVRGVGRILSGTALGLVALAAVTFAVLVVSLRLAFAPVLSPSMEPTFGPGDLLITRALPAAGIKVGDVLVLPIPQGGSMTAYASVGDDAKAGDRYVHRVVSVTTKNGKPVVKTKGDNNPTADPWSLQIDSAEVPAVVADVPNVGRLSLLTQAGWVRVTLILMVAGFALVGIKRGLLDGS